MPINISQSPNSKGIGSNILGAISKHLPGWGVKIVGACGELAQKIGKIPVKLAEEFSGYEGGTPVGDMAINGSIKVAQVAVENGTKLSVRTAGLAARSTYRALGR